MNIKNFFTKAVALLLVCLLIFVGIANLLSNVDKKQLVARVGKEDISLDEYKSLYQNYSSSANTVEEKKRLKYELLNILIEQKLLLNLTNDLGLKVGEESIKDHIKNTKHFQNDKGEFDKNKFYDTLNKLHTTEKEYVSRLKKILPAIIFMNSLLFMDNYPITFGEEIDQKIYKNLNQTRVIDIVKITREAVTDIPEPENQVLLDLYEKNKSSFQYSEYRTAKYIPVGLKYFEDQVKISDEEVHKIIEQRDLKDQRNIINLIFSTKEEAEKTKEAFIKGKIDFEDNQDIRINNIHKDFLPEGMREEVFSLKEGEISNALESNFGWHIIKVESIHKISDEDLASLKNDIRSNLAQQKSFERINDFINQVNYKIYNGATIEEVSTEYSLPIETVGPIDINGRDQNGNRVCSNNLASFIFSREKNQKNYFKSVDDIIVSVQIIDIISPKLQSFEDSRASVLELWRNEFVKEKMFEIGNNIVTKMKDNIQIEETHGIKLITKQKIYRDEQNYPFPFIKEIFSTKTVDLVTTPVMYNDGVIVGILKEMYSSDGSLNTIETAKRVMMSLKEQLISYLDAKYKIEVNHSVLEESF